MRLGVVYMHDLLVLARDKRSGDFDVANEINCVIFLVIENRKVANYNRNLVEIHYLPANILVPLLALEISFEKLRACIRCHAE